MDPASVSAMYAALVAAREALLAEQRAVALVESKVSGSASAQDEAPQIESDQAIASSRHRLRREWIDAIDEALRRLAADPDTFGVCEACGEDIPLTRLTLLPFTHLCTTCQSSEDESASEHSTRKNRHPSTQWALWWGTTRRK